MPRHQDEIYGWAKHLNDTYGIATFPIAPDAKRPLVRTSEWWGRRYPVEHLRGFRKCNLAVQCGRVSRLIVIDVDNRPASAEYFTKRAPLPRTWSVTTGSGGLHMYFRLPPDWNRPFGRTILWKGEQKHTEVAVLADRSMAICPPSRFPGAKPYRWEAMLPPIRSQPAVAPYWLLKECTDRYYEPKTTVVNGVTITPKGLEPGWKEVIDAVPDKIALYEAWGLRLASRYVNSSGWMRCHRPGQKDDTPSASVRPDNGMLWMSTGETLQLPHVAVVLGAFPTEDCCLDYLRRTYMRT